jgi:uncharacterized membrane protein
MHPRPSRFAVVSLFLVLSVASAGCLALSGLRVHATGSMKYSFMPWNLALAWVPMGFAACALWAHRARLPFAVWLAPMTLWLLFLPNAPYLVTDVVHLRNSWASAPIWFDSMMFGAFGLTGLMLGYASLYLVHRMMAERYGRRTARIATLIALMLSSAGIYLGRAMRLNSWDAFTHPELLPSIVVRRVAHPLGNPEMLTLVALMSVLLAGGYALFVVSARAAAGYVEHPDSQAHR